MRTSKSRDTSLAKAWMKTLQLNRERQLALAFGQKSKVQKLDRRMKQQLGVVIEKGVEKRK